MGFYEDKRDLVVVPALEAKGAAMTLRQSNKVVDDITGMVTSSPGGTDAPVRGLMLKYHKDEIDGETILRSDLKVMMTAKAFDANGNPIPLPFEPTPGMQLVANGVAYSVINVDPFQPGGVPVFYYVQVRK